jgi:hypothetical protein
MNKGTIYVSGPMTGYDNFNRAAFHKAANNLTDHGYNVLNPATLPDGLTQAQYMSICQPMVLCSDAIYMLSGWQNSDGAKAELALANKLQINVVYENA